MIEANLLGAVNATEAFLDQLRDGGGDLVNMSSVAGRTARPGQRRLRRYQAGQPQAARRRHVVSWRARRLQVERLSRFTP